MNNEVTKITKLLCSFDTLTLITHTRPDGDTLGCAYALFNALKKLGKNVKVVCESEISPRYRFLTGGIADISHECEGAIVCVDIATPKLAGEKYIEYAKNADIVIDHHPSNENYGKNNLVIGDAAACGEIVYDIICQMGVMDKQIANCLYTAISTDTGCFVYPSTSANTHRIASKLIEAGADTAALNKLLFRTKTRAAIEIEKRATQSLEYYFDNTIAIMLIKNDWIRELGATEDDLEGVSSIPTKIEGVEASATFRQIENNRYKLSVRSVDKIDVCKVCKQFGGGGHKNASGCTIEGDYNTYKQIFAQKLNEGKND